MTVKIIVPESIVSNVMSQAQFCSVLFTLDELGVKCNTDPINYKIIILSGAVYLSNEDAHEIITIFFERWCSVTYDIIDTIEKVDSCLQIRNNV